MGPLERYFLENDQMLVFGHHTTKETGSSKLFQDQSQIVQCISTAINQASTFEQVRLKELHAFASAAKLPPITLGKSNKDIQNYRGSSTA